VGTAIDDPAASKAARSGAIRTKAVAKRTTLLLLRLRFHILRTVGSATSELLAEECCIVGFEGAAERAKSLLAVHRQLRDESRIKALKYDVRPQLPADVLGVYVLLPA
jgi:hypothetical protein